MSAGNGVYATPLPNNSAAAAPTPAAMSNANANGNSDLLSYELGGGFLLWHLLVIIAIVIFAVVVAGVYKKWRSTKTGGAEQSFLNKGESEFSEYYQDL